MIKSQQLEKVRLNRSTYSPEKCIANMGSHKNLSQFERRDKLDIILNMLEITKEPVRKTHIMYIAKINYNQLLKYLDLLLRAELIEEVSSPFDAYKTTNKGRILLDLFNQV